VSLPAQQRESAAVVRSFDDRLDCPQGVSGRVDFCAQRHFPTQSHLAKVDETNQRCLRLRRIDVTLRGTVSSWTEDEAAWRASWSVPGVTKVEDHLVVR
jgi:BON domain